MFKERLKDCRELQGITQVELAEMIGVSKDLYNKYERTETRPNFETLAKISSVLNVSTDYLLGISDYKNIEDALLVKDNNLDKTFASLSPSSQDMILNVFHSLSDCISDFEAIRAKKYIEINPGLGLHLLNTLNKNIRAYQAVANYIKQQKELSSIVYKLNEMLRDADQSLDFVWDLAKETEQDNNSDSDIRDNIIYLRHALQPVSAGTGTYLTEECMEKIRVKFDMQTARADFCVTVSGDSMEPKFHDGDILLVHEQPDVEKGEFGVFIINDEGYVKRRGEQELISLNTKYKDIPFHPDDDIICSGKVVGVLDKSLLV